MNKKIIASLATIAVVGAIATLGTMATWTDSAKSENNVIAAGSLDLELECPESVALTDGPLTVTNGRDTTGTGDYPLVPGDIDKISSNNENRYESQNGWWNDGGSYYEGTGGDDTWTNPLEFINFETSNIPDDATLTSAKLTLDWQRGSAVTGARVRIFNGSTWATQDLTLPATADTDENQEIDLTSLGITTKAQLDALQVQFQALGGCPNWYGCSEPVNTNSKTRIDFVGVDVEYTTTTPAAWCQGPLTGPFSVTGIKPGDTGAPATIKYKNAGTVPGNLTMQIVGLNNLEKECLVPEKDAGDATCGTGNDQGELGGVLEFTTDNGSSWQTLSSLTSAISLGTVAGGADGSVVLNWRLPSTAGNIVQTDGVEFDIDFNLAQ